MFQIAAPFSAMWIMQKMGSNRGVLFVSVCRIGGMCFSSNEKAKGGDKNRGEGAEKIGAKTEKAGSRCRKYGGGKARSRERECEREWSARKKEEERTKVGRSARKKQAKETKAGKEKTKGSEEREGWREKTKAGGGKKRNVGVADGHFPSCTSAPTPSCAACCMMA